MTAQLRHYWLLGALLFVAIVMAGGIVFFVRGQTDSERFQKSSSPYPALFWSEKGFTESVRKAEPRDPSPLANIRAGILPHHLLASDLIAEEFSTIALKENPKTIILVGPNHNNRGGAILSSVRPWGTPFGKVESDTAVVESLHSSSVVSLWNDGFEEEHSIGAIVPFVKHYFPNAQIVPIVIRSDIGRVSAERLGKSLAALLNDESVLLLASIDFSHYQTRAEAERNDQETWQAIKAFDLQLLSTFGNDHLDAPWTLVAFLAALKEKGILGMKLLQNTNSGALANDNTLLTTSYFTVLFGK